MRFKCTRLSVYCRTLTLVLLQWPGFSSFAYLFAEDHSRHQPAWENGYSDFLNFVSRNHYILQKGKPKRDIAFWDKQTAQNDTFPPLYNATDLIAAGKYIFHPTLALTIVLSTRQH